MFLLSFTYPCASAHKVCLAIVSLIPAGERNREHYRIGLALMKNMPPDMVAQRIFDLVAQLNHGLEIVSTQSEREVLARLNVAAGEQSLRATAFAPALNYLSVARDLLGSAGWTACPQLTNTCYVSLVDAEYCNSYVVYSRVRYVMSLDPIFHLATTLGRRPT